MPPRVKERFNARLFRNGKAAFDLTARVHEGIRAEGVVQKAPNGGLLHFRPIGLHEQMLKENKYSTLKAEMKAEQGARAQPVNSARSLSTSLRSYLMDSPGSAIGN